MTITAFDTTTRDCRRAALPPAPVQAQTPATLVSNIGQNDSTLAWKYAPNKGENASTSLRVSGRVSFPG